MSSRVFNKSIYKVSVVFVDDNDQVIDGENAEEKISSIITGYSRLYSVTGEYIEEKKSKIFS